MSVLAFALALAETVAPAVSPFEDFYRPIWSDIRLSGTSDTGNAVMNGAWVFGREGETVALHMEAMDCRRSASDAQCAFSVRRSASLSPDTRPVAGAPALPALVHCHVDFSLDEEGQWYVVHTTRRGVAHSMTSMRCRTEGAYPL